MRHSWLTILLMSVIIAISVTAQAGQETLDSLIQTGLNNNPELRAADYRVKASAYTAKASGILPDPKLTVGILNLPRSSLALDETPMSGIMLGLSQTIPWPGKLGAKSRHAHLARKRDEADLDALRNRLIREITETYHEYSYRLLSERTIRENLALTDVIVEVTEERYARGEVSAHDVFKVQTMRSRLAIKLLKAEQMQASARLQLQRIVKDSALVYNLPPYLPERDYRFSRKPGILKNPHLQNAELAVVQADTRRSLSRARYWPDITLGVDYRIRKEIPMDPVAGEDWLSFRVGVNVPLWFLAKQKNQTRASELALLTARENRNAVRDILTQKLEDTGLALDVINESLQQYDSTILPQVRAGFETARIAYEVDRIDFNALLSAQMDLLDVQLERLELVFRWNATLARWHELAGTIL